MQQVANGGLCPKGWCSCSESLSKLPLAQVLTSASQVCTPLLATFCAGSVLVHPFLLLLLFFVLLLLFLLFSSSFSFSMFPL